MVKRSIRDMMNEADNEVIKAEEGIRETGQRSMRGSATPLQSPILNRRNSALDNFRPKGISIPLPVTKGELPLRYEELDPLKCFPSERNPRDQRLLSMSDPNVARIARSIDEEGQRDPVLARPVPGENGELTFEIVYGTTRLYIAKNLGIKVKAWVGEIPEADISRLARAENDERRELSAWEKGCYLKRLMGTVYLGRSIEFVAEQEGMSRPNLSKLLRIPDVDLEVLQLLQSPHALSVRSGPQLVSFLESLSPDEKAEYIEAARGEAPYESTASLIKKMAELKQAKSQPVEVKVNKPMVITSTDGKQVAKITAHRTQQGQYKVDLFDFRADEIEALTEFLKSRRKG